MTLAEVRAYYGSYVKATRAINYSTQAATRWKAQGFVSARAQILFEDESKGKLVARIRDAVRN